MSKPIVYLAGPISGQTYEQATSWRDELTKALCPFFLVLSPMRQKTELREVNYLYGEYRHTLLSRAETIVARDLTDVDRSDVLIVLNPKGSVGTCIEIGYALKSQKPIVLIAEPNDTIRDHPFVKRLPKLVIVDNLEDAAYVVCSLFAV